MIEFKQLLSSLQYPAVTENDVAALATDCFGFDCLP